MEINIAHLIKRYIRGLRDSQYTPFKNKIAVALQVLTLSIQGFSRDLCSLRASALTLYSVLSIVPIIAMLFGVAKGFGLEKTLQERLLAQTPRQETMVLQLIEFAKNLLESTKGEVVAGTGIIILFWTIIRMIGNIEESFNGIWKVAHDRPLNRKFTDYLSLMLLAPILLVSSGSITVFLKTQLTWLVNIIHLEQFGEWLVIEALRLLPLLLMTGLFAFMFIFMPNRKIQYKPGIIAGAVTALLYYLAQWAYLSLQIGVSQYNAIYGSFAALPLFVAWLQIGWMIVLFGCEIAFFLQNYENYQHNSEFSNLSFSLHKIIALQITHLIIKNLVPINQPLTAGDIAKKLSLPIAVVQSVIQKLIDSHILVEFKNHQECEIYQPAVDFNKLTVAYVINQLEQSGQNNLPGVNQDALFAKVVSDFRKQIESSGQDRLLKDI